MVSSKLHIMINAMRFLLKKAIMSDPFVFEGVRKKILEICSENP